MAQLASNLLTREHPFEPPLTGGHPPLKFPHTHYLGQRGAEKPSTSLAIFMGLSLIPITSIWSAS